MKRTRGSALPRKAAEVRNRSGRRPDLLSVWTNDRFETAGRKIGEEAEPLEVEARLTAIDRGEALRYLGIRGPLPADLEKELPRCEGMLLDVVRPRAVWKLLQVRPDGMLAGTAFRPAGEQMRNLLACCPRVILMAATLGAETDALIRRLQTAAPADALIVDALANAAIENVCGSLWADLAEALAPRFLSPRFSPGYGDFPLAQQAELFAVLDVFRRIGVTLTPGGLMVPQKSVTALIGVSDEPLHSGPSGCAGCRLAGHCSYRKEGQPCGR